jgi:hypothetical protein
MYNYVKSIDPHKHLISSSCTQSLNVMDIYNTLDFIQTHDYKDIYTNTSDNFQEHFFIVIPSLTDTYNKPYMNGEWGYFVTSIPYVPHSVYDNHGLEFHNTSWSAIFSVAMASLATWNWQDYVHGNNLYKLFKPISIFMNSLNLPSEKFRAKKIIGTKNGLRTYYMTNTSTDTIYGWTQDVNFHFQNLRNLANGTYYLNTMDPIYRPPSSSLVNDITITTNTSGFSYVVKWYSTETGLIYSTSAAQSINGKITFSIPTALRTSKFGDGVFMIYLDCSKNIWRSGNLSNTANANVAGDLICHKVTGTTFYKSNTNTIEALWWNTTNNSWEQSQLNNASTNNVAGSLVMSPDEKIFYRTTSNSINYIYFDNVTATWKRVDLSATSGYNVAGDLVAASNNTIFYRTTNNAINAIYLNNGVYNWSGLNSASGYNVAGNLATNSSNQVFYRSTTNSINCIYWANNIWNWSGLNSASGTNANGAIAISSNNNVFYKTSTNTLNYLYYSNGTWYNSNMDAAINDVAGDLKGDNNGKMFYRSTNNNLRAAYLNGSNWAWSGLDNCTSGNVTNKNLAIDNLGNVFFINNTNTVHRAFFKSQCFYGNSTEFQQKSMNNQNVGSNNSNSEIVYEEAQSNLIQIIPNPAHVNTKIIALKEISSYSISTIEGKVIHQDFHVNSKSTDLNLEKFNEGVYITKVNFLDGSTITKKIIKINN